VDLFFVLSGFLISGLLFREHQKFGTISFKNFFIRRGFKIYPSFYVLILVTVIVRLRRGSPVPFGDFAHEILFLQNYFVSLWGHTWSLAVEEHFYIMLPLALVVCLRLKRSDQPFRWVPIVFIAIAITCLGLRVYRASANYESTLFPTHLRIDSLFAGVVISYFYHYYAVNFAQFARRYRWWLLALGVICFIPTFVFQLERTPFIYTYELSILWVGGGLVLVSLINATLPEKWPTRVLSFVGSRSYSIYLWHIPLAWALGFQKAHYIRGFNWYSYAGLFLTGSVLLGIFMASLIEYPALQLRDRLVSSRSQPLNLLPAPRKLAQGDI